MATAGQRRVAFGPFEFDPAQNVLWRGGERVEVQPKALELLRAFVEQPGVDWSKDELLARLWPDRVVEEGNLTQTVSVLRKALRDGDDEKRYIVTVPGTGYRFAGEPAPLERRPRLLRWAVAALALACGLAAAGWMGVRSGSDQVARAETVRIAVLPLAGSGDDARVEALGDGVADELIVRLGRLSNVQVTSRSSAFSYKGKVVDIREVGEALGVDRVLEGSVRLQDGRVRVAVQLSDASDGLQLWSEIWERPVEDLFAIQDQVAEEVAALLQPATPLPKTVSVPANLEAYAAYAGGMKGLHDRIDTSLVRAREDFTRAIELDPDYAPAYAGLAETLTVMWAGRRIPHSEAHPAVKRLAERSIELDPKLPHAWAVMGAAAIVESWDFNAAEKFYQRAIELNPSFPLAHYWMGLLDEWRDEPEETLVHFRRAEVLDPLASNLKSHISVVLNKLGRLEESEAAIAALGAVAPDSPRVPSHLATLRMFEGRPCEAVDLFERGSRSPEGELMATQAARSLVRSVWAYLECDRPDKALEAYHELQRISEQRWISTMHLSEAAAWLGRREEALDLLERSYEERDGSLMRLLVDLAWVPYHGDPRFEAVVEKVGLRR